MNKKSRTEITIETDRVFIVRQRKRAVRAWCAACAEVASMITTEQAANVAGLSARAIYRLVEAGTIHFAEQGEGLLLVCLNSLSLLKDDAPATGEGTDLSPEKTSIRLASKTIVEQLPEDKSQAETQEIEAEALTEDAGEGDSAQNLTPQKTRWVLTSEAFDKLLDCLDKDREQAGQKYERIRRRLVKFFECRACLWPEDLADETINRVARRINEGKEIWTANLAGYFYGVARNILHEYWGAPERNFSRIENIAPLAHPSTGVGDFTDVESIEWRFEKLLEALEQCIEKLSPENRDLIIRYYKGEKSEKIKNRKAIAKRLKIPPNALRIRAHRIREKLERAIEDRLK